MTDHPTASENTADLRRQFVSALVEAQNDVSLRQYLERDIAALRNEMGLKFQNIEDRLEDTADALALSAGQNKEHFAALNNEAERIRKAAEITVSRDTWDAFKEEYNGYKEETNSKLTLRAGQLQGLGISWQAALAIFGGFCAGIVAWSALKPAGQPIAPMTYTIPISPAQPIPAPPAPR